MICCEDHFRNDLKYVEQRLSSCLVMMQQRNGSNEFWLKLLRMHKHFKNALEFTIIVHALL